MSVGESCETCKKVCIAKVGISTTQSVSRASIEISRRKIVDLSFGLLRFSQLIGASGNQIKSLEKGIINDREGISSYIYIYIYTSSSADRPPADDDGNDCKPFFVLFPNRGGTTIRVLILIQRVQYRNTHKA